MPANSGSFHQRYPSVASSANLLLHILQLLQVKLEWRSAGSSAKEEQQLPSWTTN